MPADLPLGARWESDGVLVSLLLDRNPMPAGEPTWIHVEVKNTGSDDLIWFHDGCAMPVRVWGQMDARWREGLPMSGDAGRFKRYALGLSIDRPGPPSLFLSFTKEEHIGLGGVGCADVGLSDTLEPEQTIERRLQWNGLVHPRLDPAPAGPIQLVGTFAHYWRAARGEPANLADQTIEVTLDAWIEPGKPPTQLDPPEVVDIALMDPAFAARFATKDFANGVEEWVRYLPTLDRWQVGALEWNTSMGPRLNYLVIHPVTGEVEDRVDRPWIQETDGWP